MLGHSDYRDIVIDLVNSAKVGLDRKKLEVVLHQIREIALHRDQSVLPHILKDVLDLAIGANAHIVYFLVTFAADALRINFSLLPVVLSSYNFLMTTDSDKVHRFVSLELTRIYSKAAMAVADMVNAPEANEAAVKQTWKQLCSITDKLIDKISSIRATEQLRTNGIALAENLVLFGLPAPQMKADPRRRRAAGTEDASLSVASLTSMHPFVLELKSELEKAAEDVFSKLVLWAYQGGPQGSPFTPEQMAILGQSLSMIAGQRYARADGSDQSEPRSSKAAKALHVMLKGKKSVCNLMAGESRKALVLAIHRFIGTSPPDPADDIPKLREALTELEAFGFTDNIAKEAGKKRDREAMGAEEDVGDSAADAEAVRVAALAALELSENTILQAKKSEQAVPHSGTGSSDLSTASVVETELAPDLMPSLNDGNLAVARVSSRSSAERGVGVEYLLNPLQITAEQASMLAAASLQRLLSSFYLMKAEGPKASAAHSRMSVRTVIAQTAVETGAGVAPVIIPLFSVLPAEIDRSLLVGVPMEATLARPMWGFLSFVLSPLPEDSTGSKMDKQASLQAAVREKLPLLVMLLKELLDQDEAGQPGAKGIYNDLVLITLGRMLQSVHLRDLAKTFFAAMPRVPLSCVSLLRLLLFTGTKPVPASSNVGRSTRVNRGTRQEALSLLGALVFAVDEEVGAACLNELLWCAVSEDFEVRAKAVALIVNDVMKGQEWVYSAVSVFALQTLAQLIGVPAVQARQGEVRKARALLWDTAAPDKSVVSQEDVLPSSSADGHEHMDVDTVEGPLEDSQNAAKQGVAMVDALEFYDDGASYGGSFSKTFVYPTAALDNEAGIAAIDIFLRRCLQLLSQLCTADPALLGAFVDATGALAVAAGASTPEQVAEMAKAAVQDAQVKQNPSPADPVAVAASVGSDILETNVMVPKVLGAVGRFQRAYLMMRAELGNVLPALVVHQPTQKIFEALARSDPVGKPLLAYSLEVLHSDMFSPATKECIAAVTHYLHVTTGTTRDNAANIASSESNRFLVDLSESDLRFCFPLLSGFQRPIVEAVLHRIFALLSTVPDALNRIVTRLVRSRPPVLTKADLLTWLHRLDPDKFGLDRVQIRDLLGVLLDREDFDGETIRETLFHLLQDEVPCLYLMRTGILAAKKYKDVRKYLLSETVPQLIRKKVWAIRDENSGKYPVWEGVVQCVRLMADQKDAEQMLRCVLSLDGPRLSMVMKIAPKVAPILASLLRTLSVKEREEIITGQWAGIAHEKGKVDSEKKKIIEDLQSMKL